MQPGVAKTTRICTYDRAGMGWSETSPEPRTARVFAKELHTLLAKANESGPYVTLDRVASLGVAAGGDIAFQNGVGLNVKARRDLAFTNSAAGLLTVKGSAEVTDSLSLAMGAGQVTARGSVIGVLLTRQANLAEDTRVLLNTKQALAFGAAFGAVFGLLRWILGRRR